MSDQTQEPIDPQEPVENVEAVEDHTPDEPQTAPAPEWTPEQEKEARELYGWKSPDEWKGDVPPGYIDDPRAFMERADNFGPYRKLKERLETIEAQSSEKIRKLERLSEQAIKRQQKQFQEQYERDIRAITSRQRQAVEAGDTEEFDRLENFKRNVKPPEDFAIEQENPERKIDPYLVEYRQSKEGAWINDPVLWKVARDAVDAAFQMGVPLPTVQDQVKYAREKAEALYPHMFKKPETEQKQHKQRVDGGGLASGAKSGAWESLPADAKSQFKQFVAQKIFKDTPEDRKMYAEEYNNA